MEAFIKVGDKVTFDYLKDIKIRGVAAGSLDVTGTVIEVFPEHHWCSVEYFLGPDNTRFRTSFNFVDIGITVFPCK